MSLEIKVPEVGESITEVTIASWLKNDGDFVEMDEPIAELESDKATFELTAEAAGVLRQKASEGETLDIGALVCEIDEEAEKETAEDKQQADKPETEETKEKETKKDQKETKKPDKKSGNIVEMKVPEVGESITEVTISSWIKNDGDFVELDEEIAEIESDKATFELPAEATGYLQVVAGEGDTLKIGDLICKIEEAEKEEAGADKKKEKEADKEPEREAKAEEDGKSHAAGHPSPAASKILKEAGIDPKSVSGTGPGGRITKEDALKATSEDGRGKEKGTREKVKEKDKEEKEATPPTSQPFSRDTRRQKLSSLRKTVARRLVSVKNETAMLTTFNEVDMKPIMDIRKKYKEMFKEKFEVNLGFMSFFTNACCMALKEWPSVNARIDGEEIVYNDFVDMSIAVSAPKGLVVPVIRNAESLSFDQIEKEVIRLATKARDNKLTIEEMTGGTFTITNGGVFGSMLSTPIINAPQSAILGMHNIVERPVAKEGEIVIRPVMFVALSYDHRIVDGRESVSFLVRVKQLLEDPTRLMIGV